MLRRDVLALWIAARDVRTPFLARAMALVVAAYALSPIDLIPDFIPVLGLLDDAILLPLGIWIALRLIPRALMKVFRQKAETLAARPHSWVGAVLVGSCWLSVLLVTGWLLRPAG